MSTPDTGTFAVLNFSLTREEDGRPAQRTASCGTFLDVEQAFDVAREEAERELNRRRAALSQPATIIELLDTEWGYDVRQNF